MRYLWLTGVGGFILFAIGMILSLKYGDEGTKWQAFKCGFCTVGGEILFWGSVITAIVWGIIKLFHR